MVLKTLSLLLRCRFVPTRMPRCDNRQLRSHTKSFARSLRLDFLFNSEVTKQLLLLSFAVKDFLSDSLFFFRAKQIGHILKFFLCLCLPAAIILWLVLGILASVLGGALYGFLSPIFATFDAVGEGKPYPFFHCFYDGTWSTLKRSFTVVRDFKDVCFHSYFSLMDELRICCPDQKQYEIRLIQLPGALVVSALGILVDLPVITLVAICKSPYMLFKGWHRLFQDLIGREGPFLETMCVPIAGLVILLWPLAVVGAVLGSVVSSIFLGAYAGVVSYQESSFYYGLCFMVASVSIYDEYSTDILDMPEGSCFPRPKYREKGAETTAFSGPIPRLGSVKNTASTREGSVKVPMIDIKPLDVSITSTIKINVLKVARR